MAEPRACHGSASRPTSEIGSPTTSRTLNRLWPMPVDPQLEQAGRSDGEVAGQGRRVVPGEDVEAVDAQRVGRGLARQRTAEDHPVAEHPRREDEERDSAGDRDEPELAGPPADEGPGHAQPDRLVAGQRGEADEHAQKEDPRVDQANGCPIARDARHQEAGAQGEDREQHRRVGQGAVEEERQVDRGGQAGADGQRPRPGPWQVRVPRRHPRRGARPGPARPTR